MTMRTEPMPEPGDRIMVLGTISDDPMPVPAGSTGTVVGRRDWVVTVDWDDADTSDIDIGPVAFRII